MSASRFLNNAQTLVLKSKTALVSLLLFLLFVLVGTNPETTFAAGSDDYPSNLKSAAIDSVIDPWNFLNRECTSFVAWRLNNDNGVAFHNYYKGSHWGHAKNWGVAARSVGIIVDSSPAVGSVAWSDSGYYGHVAWVSAVNGNNVTVEEYNYNYSGRYQTRTVAKSSFTGYIHIKDLGLSGPILSGKPQVAIEPGTYIIRSAIGNKMLDVMGNGTANGTSIGLCQPNGSAAQIFQIGKNWRNNNERYIQHITSGKYADTDGNKAEARLNLIIWEGNGADGQQWIFEDAGGGWYYIRNPYGYYFDVVDGRNANGANVWVYNFNGSNAQKWKPMKVSGKTRDKIAAGYYTIESKIGGKNLDVYMGATTNNANVVIWTPNSNPQQRFRIGWNNVIESSTISYSGKYLDTSGGDGSKNVQLYEGNGGHGQNWFFEPAGDGYYYIRNLFGYYLDVDNAKNADGTNVKTWTFNGGDAQKWKLTKIETDISKASVTVNPSTYVYDGTAKKPAVTVKSGSMILVEGQDYTVSYSSNVSIGTASVTVVGMGIFTGSKTGTFTINPVPVATVSLDKSSLSLEVGKSAALKATVSPASATNKAITWTSSNTKVVTVDSNGNVKAVGKGEATITATVGGKSTACKVTVTAKNNGSSFGSGSSTALPTPTPNPLPSQTQTKQVWKRLAGGTAYGTMQAITAEGWSQANTVIIATFNGYWDALSASSLAGMYDAPILLTDKNSLTPTTRNELVRLGARNVIIVGGTSAVSAAVESKIAALGIKAYRIAGKDAQVTAIQIAASVGRSNTCIIATSAGYWDALSASSYAYAKKTPIYLTAPNGTLRADTLKAIKSAGHRRAIIVGGTAAIPESTASNLAAAGLQVERQWGAIAIQTSLSFADFAISEGMKANYMGVATSNGYWDALTGGALCGRYNGVLVLANNNNTTGTHIPSAFGSQMSRAYVFGGETALNKQVFNAFSATAKSISRFKV